MNTTVKPRDRADIPNAEGFLLTAFLQDGTAVKTVVSKRRDGTHFLTGVDFTKVVTWEPRKKQKAKCQTPQDAPQTRPTPKPQPQP